MTKNIILITLAIVIILMAGLAIDKFNFKNNEIVIEKGIQANSKDGIFMIDGKAVTLIDGYYEEILPGPAAYF